MKSKLDASVCTNPPSQFKRVPVTQEYIVAAMTKEAAGERVEHPAIKHFPNALYESLRKLVFNLASKYALSCGDTPEDLAQDCWLRVVKDLPKFDPARGCVTTFVTLMSYRALNTRRRYLRKHFDSTVSYDGEEAASSKKVMESMSETVDFAVRADIAEALRALAKLHPDKIRLIHGIFGNPDAVNFVPLTPQGFPSISRRTGIDAKKVYAFYREVARPFLRERLRSVEGVG